jgi:hypothetical protein
MPNVRHEKRWLVIVFRGFNIIELWKVIQTDVPVLKDG